MLGFIINSNSKHWNCSVSSKWIHHQLIIGNSAGYDQFECLSTQRTHIQYQPAIRKVGAAQLKSSIR